MMGNESFRYIKNTWLEGNGTLCIGIPAKIVRKLNLNQNSLLLVELVDENIIVIKKHDPHFTRTELNKIHTKNNNLDVQKGKTVTSKQPDNNNSYNPLDRLNNI